MCGDSWTISDDKVIKGVTGDYACKDGRIGLSRTVYSPIITLERVGNVRGSCSVRNMSAPVCDVSDPAPVPPAWL